MHGGHTHGSMASVGFPLPAPFEEGSLPPPNTKLPACCCPKLMHSTGPGVSFGRAGVGASLQPLRHPQLRLLRQVWKEVHAYPVTLDGMWSAHHASGCQGYWCMDQRSSLSVHGQWAHLQAQLKAGCCMVKWAGAPFPPPAADWQAAGLGLYPVELLPSTCSSYCCRRVASPAQHRCTCFPVPLFRTTPLLSDRMACTCACLTLSSP